MSRPVAIDLMGRIFGAWRVLGYTKKGLWICKCACGTVREVPGWHLRTGKTLSCGCSRSYITENLVGKTFGQLQVVKMLPREKDAQAHCKVKCSCGKTVTVFLNNLKSGRTKSCGCARLKSAKWVVGAVIGDLKLLKSVAYKRWKVACTGCGEVRESMSATGIRKRMQNKDKMLRSYSWCKCADEYQQQRHVDVEKWAKANGFGDLMYLITHNKELPSDILDERWKFIHAYCEAHPRGGALLAEVLGVSRERVRQLLFLKKAPAPQGRPLLNELTFR